MIAAATTTYLITGANRGIGLGLVTSYLARSNSTVVAGVRDPEHATSKALEDLPKGAGSSLIVVKIDSLSETDADEAVAELQSKYNITALDVVIANAGVAKVYPEVHNARSEDMIEHYRINVIAIPILLRAVLPLLKQSTRNAKFITIGSTAGTIGAMEKVPIPNSAYGPSKAALSWISRKIHFENPDIVSFNVHPGWVCASHLDDSSFHLISVAWNRD